MNKRVSSLSVLLGLLSAMVLGTASARAATAPATGQALEIAPPVISLNVSPGQSTKVQIFLRDISSSELLVSNQINDFVAGGEDGTPKLLLKDTKSNNPYSMKGWIAPLPNINLVPREIKSLTATINVPANASPGGHYGVIRFTGTPAGLEGQGVSLSASLGALMLLTVSGDIHESLSVQQFYATQGGAPGSLFSSTPINFVEVFKNTGNVHVQPTGQVTVKNIFGKKVAAVNVNVPPANVLPASSRKFEQPLDKTVIGTKHLFGRYTANLKVVYGGDKKVLTSNISFWVIPYKPMIIIALLLVIGFFVGRWLLRGYNRRIVERAQKNSKK